VINLIPINNGIEDRLGKCYQNAFHYVEKNNQYRLVHGYITDPIYGRVIDHAWAESSNKVYDPTADRIYIKSEYEKMFRAEVVMKYNKREMYFMASKFEHYGPWHKIPKGKVRWWKV